MRFGSSMIIILGVDDLNAFKNDIIKQIKGAIVSSATETLVHIDEKLTEASTEIATKIQELIDANVDVLSAEDKATLDAIKGKAEALADIVPDAPSPTVDGTTVGETGELPVPDDNEPPVADDGSNPGQL